MATATNSNVFADMFSMQMNFLKDMSNAATGAFSNFMPNTAQTSANPFFGKSAENPASQMFGLYETWRNIYNSWASSMGKVMPPAQNVFGSFSTPAGANAFQNLSSMAETYFKLFEFWAPMMKTMQEKGWNEETFRAAFNPQQYERVLNTALNFVSPEALQSFGEEVSKAMSAYGEFSRDANAEVSDMMRQSAQAMTHMVSGNTDEAVKMYLEMLNKSQKPFAPIANMLFIGKDRAALELSQELLKAYAHFAAQYSEMQKMTAQAGQKAMEECARFVGDLAKSGKPVQNYDEFFKVWVRSNETAFDVVFKTEEYSRLQGALNTSSAKVREYADKLMELFMGDIPVALRSELDEAYRSIHELKRQMRALERKVSEQQEVIESLQPESKTTKKAAKK